MSSQSVSAKEAIKMAIDLEKNGRQFYKEAEAKTQNESGKRIFKLLAEEEIAHLRTFENMLDQDESLSNWKTWVGDLPVNRQVPVFSENAPAATVTKERTDEIEALRLAMKQEREAIAFFERVMDQAEDDLTRDIFEFIRDQEIYHYDLLQAEIDSITRTGFWFDLPEFRMDGKM
jgi:rubrerythrin